jgi:hypothetical protein
VRYLFVVLACLLFVPLVVAGSVAQDRVALEALYGATGGSGWHDSTGWLSSSDLGSWYGVETNSAGRVVRVDLQGNNLRGFLPSEIGALDRVEYFNVKLNRLEGELPAEIGGMVSLTHLLLNGRSFDMHEKNLPHPGKPPGGSGTTDRSNNFYGSFPSSIGDLENLLYLEASGTGLEEHTGFTGSLPSSIGNLHSLRGFYIGFNSFDDLPSSLKQLNDLRFLGIGYMNGKLDGFNGLGWLSGLDSLRVAWIGNNRYGGELPDLSRSSDLQLLAVDRAGFSGEFPAYLVDGTLPRVNMLQLAWNSFTGELPEFGVTGLTAFTIVGSDMHGEIPHSFWEKNRRIINTDFDRNNFVGTLPEDLTHLTGLRNLRIANNDMHGPWPTFDWENEAGRDRHPLRSFSRLSMQNNRFVPDDVLREVNGRPLIEWYTDRDWTWFRTGGQVFGASAVARAQEGGVFEYEFFEVSHPDNRYQWRKDGEDLSGATNRRLRVTDVSPSDEGVYTLRVSNPQVPFSSVSEEVVFELGEPTSAPEEDASQEESEEDVFDPSVYASPRSGFSVDDRVRVVDTAVFSTGYYSYDGVDWTSFDFREEEFNGWMLEEATTSGVPVDARYYAVFSCSWSNQWVCEDTWQVLVQ